LHEPDVMTGTRHMLWMLEEYETIHGHKAPGLITGKPVGMGGSLGRTEATGYGVIFTVREALKEVGVQIENTTASPARRYRPVGAFPRHAATARLPRTVAERLELVPG